MMTALRRYGDIRTFLTLLAVIVLVYQDSFTEILNLGLLNYIDEVFILVLVAAAALKIHDEIRPLTVKLMVAAAAFLVLGAAYCVFFSEYSVVDLVMSSFLSVKFFLMVIAVSIIRPGKRLVEDVYLSLKAVGVFTAATGILNFLFPAVWWSLISFAAEGYRLSIPAVTGIFIHQQQYGWFMLFVAVLYYSEYKAERNTRKLLGFVVFAVLSVLSVRAKVIVGIAAVILADVFVVERVRIPVKKLLPVIAVLAVGYLLFGDLIMRQANLFLLGNSENASARYALLATSLVIMAEYFPCGVGFGKYGSWYARIRYSEYYYKYEMNTILGLTPEDPSFATDTFWPSVMGETGAFGLVLYVYFLVMVIKEQLKNIWNKELSPFARQVACFGFLALVQSLVESMGEPSFNSSPQNIFLGCIVGLSITAGYMDQSGQLTG